MNSLQIQYFLSVAEHLNFTKAAQVLYTSQPSISKQIALLEKELGLQLFIRTKHYVQLTPAGTILYKEFGEISRQLHMALEKARQASLGVAGELSIGCLEVLNTNLFLPDAIRVFTRNYPNIKLSFESHSFKTLRKKLIHGELDIVFTLSFALADLTNIERHNIYNTRAHIVFPASHPLAGRWDLTLADFKDDCFIITSQEESPEGMDFVFNLCKKYGFIPRKVIESPTFESQVLYLESGLGIAVMDDSLRIYGNENLRFVEIKDEEAVVSINAVWKKDNLNPAVLLFTNQFTR